MERPANVAPASGPTRPRETARPGSSVRAQRKLLGLTQEELAAEVGCSRSHVKRVERGDTNPSPESRSKFAAALGADPLELFAAFPPARAEEDAAAIAARRAKVAELYGEHTMPELEDLLGVDTTTIWRDVHAVGLEVRPAHTRPKYERTERLCLRCGKPLPYRYPSDHNNRRGLYHRECFEEGGVVNTCPMCGKERHRCAAHAHKKCCGYRCAQLYRWHVSRKGLEKLVRKCYRGYARQRWLGRIFATKPPSPGGRPRGRPTVELTDEQRVEVAKLHAQGWGRRAIANRLLVGERAVRNELGI